MANPYHHALSSVKKWGGVVDDYIEVHSWFDESKAFLADFRHRALRHHAEGIFLCERIFGNTIEISTCAKCGLREHTPALHEFTPKLIPVRWIGEQHVQEDLGRIPTAADWLTCIQPQPWMNRSRQLSKELEAEDSQEPEKLPEWLTHRLEHA